MAFLRFLLMPCITLLQSHVAAFTAFGQTSFHDYMFHVFQRGCTEYIRHAVPCAPHAYVRWWVEGEVINDKWRRSVWLTIVRLYTLRPRVTNKINRLHEALGPKAKVTTARTTHKEHFYWHSMSNTCVTCVFCPAMPEVDISRHLSMPLIYIKRRINAMCPQKQLHAAASAHLKRHRFIEFATLPELIVFRSLHLTMPNQAGQIEPAAAAHTHRT